MYVSTLLTNYVQGARLLLLYLISMYVRIRREEYTPKNSYFDKYLQKNIITSMDRVRLTSTL